MHAMNRFARAAIASLAVIAGASALLLFAGSAAAAAPCAERLIADWSDNGRIDRLYPLDCYQAAIDAIPVDLRDYTNAADVIGRALTAATRQQPPTGGAASSTVVAKAAPDVDTSGASSLPLPLLVLVGVSFVVLAAGAAGHVSRRRRDAPPSEPATE
jgi:hypothetical protein